MRWFRHSTWIWPTPSFGGLCLLLLGIWYAAASQSNGAAYVLFFLVLSVTLVSIPHTYLNATGLIATARPVTPVFSGEEVTMLFDVATDPKRQVKGQLQARLRGNSSIKRTALVEWAPREGSARVTLTMVAPKRGEHAVPDLVLETTYPLGFLRCARKYPVSERYLVYPRPAGQSELPRSAILVAAHQPEGTQTGGDDFAGLRAYIPGESQRHIDWKAVARGQPLLVKQFSGQRSRDVVLDWDTLSPLNYEDRLSQLALWVRRAEQEQHSYALYLPERRIPHGGGEAHYRECLQSLALFPVEKTS